MFTPFWNALSDQGISYAAAAGAYQNGFFWKVIFDQQHRAMKKAGRKPKDPKEPKPGLRQSHEVSV